MTPRLEGMSMSEIRPVLDVLQEVLAIWNLRQVSERTSISMDRLKLLKKPKSELELADAIRHSEYMSLLSLIPVYEEKAHSFTFIDLFAGIGGIRKGFETAGGRCVFTSEWNSYAQRTYKANFPSCPEHTFNSDIKEITQPAGVPDGELAESIRNQIPEHDVLLAGFPCQPFSIAGVSKKNSLGKDHGFECEDQGQLFFDIIRILNARKPPIVILENVKNLKSHDKGNTFKVIKRELVSAGYWIANLEDDRPDPKIIDGKNFVPQHRERVILVGFKKDIAEGCGIPTRFSLSDIEEHFPKVKLTLADILDPNEAVDPKYTLTPKLWDYLVNYAEKHKAKGNGFGFGLISHTDSDYARTLSARYYKDGSEILIEQPEMQNDPIRRGRPRRLTPQECARLMGFYKPGEKPFELPVSDTQAYKQFGNSVVVPVFEAIAKMVVPFLMEAKEPQSEKKVA